MHCYWIRKVSNLYFTFNQYADTKYDIVRPLLQSVLPDMLKMIYLIHKQQATKLAIDLVSQILFETPELFMPNLCTPLINSTDEDSNSVSNYSRSVRSIIERLVRQRRGYVQQILFSIASDKEHLLYASQIMLNHCFNALRMQAHNVNSHGQEEEERTGNKNKSHSIDLCLGLLYELTQNQSKQKGSRNCIVAFSSELCTWIQNICKEIMEPSKPDAQELETMFGIILDLCIMVLSSWEDMYKKKQQAFMKQLLTKTYSQLESGLSDGKARFRRNETIQKVNYILQMCHSVTGQ